MPCLLTHRHHAGGDIAVLPGDGAVTESVAPWHLVPIWVSAQMDSNQSVAVLFEYCCITKCINSYFCCALTFFVCVCKKMTSVTI